MKSHLLKPSLARLLTLVFALAPMLSGGQAKEPDISFLIRKLNKENIEGPSIQRSYITVGDQRIVIGLPNEAKPLGERDSLVLRFADGKLDGEITVRQSPVPFGTNFAEDVNKYRSVADAGMPKGSGDIKPGDPKMRAYPFNGWTSLGFSWEYSFYGKSCRRTVAFIDLEVGIQLTVETIAAAKDADKVEEAARQFMASWYVADPGA